MADPTKTLLLVNVAVAFYLVGAIWAHEVDVFRTWQLVAAKDFARVQRVHWRKLPYWVFTPLGLALLGSILLVGYHPPLSPAWAVLGNLGCLLASLVLTGIFWGPWQAKLSKDPAGPRSTYLSRILATHWIRTALVTAYGVILLAWAIIVLA